MTQEHFDQEEVERMIQCLRGRHIPAKSGADDLSRKVLTRTNSLWNYRDRWQFARLDIEEIAEYIVGDVRDPVTE
jgi:hypothetical protein